MAKFRKLALLIATILLSSVMAFAVGCTRIAAIYTVTFQNADGTVLQTAEYSEGETPEYTGETPVKASTADKVFTFSGWDKEIAPVSAAITYTAVYTESARKYAITWKNEDGSVLLTEEVAYGTVPAYEGTPAKESTADKVFTFAGWNEEPVAVVGEATYTAFYTESARKYAITWKNEDGSVLLTEEVAYGTVPAYEGTPAKESTVDKVFTFAGWNEEPVAVVGEATYTAVYTEAVRTYSIILSVNGATQTLENVPYGTSAEALYAENMIPEVEGHTFIGWYIDGVKVLETDVVTGDLIITADFEVNSYLVKFVNYNDAVLYEQTLEYGELIMFSEEPTRAPDDDVIYKFVGWSPEYVLGTTTVPASEVTFVAQYETEARKYAITFANNDGSELATAQVAWGEVPVYEGTPAYAGFSIFVQNFTGWDKELAAVNGEATYTATYTAGEGAQLSSVAALEAGVWECMGANGDGTYYICGAGRQFGWNAGNFVEAQNGIGISNALVMQAKEAGYNYLEVAVKATNWFSVSNKPVYNAWAMTHQAYCDMVKPTGDYIVIDFSQINQADGYTLFATCGNVVHVMNARFVNTPVTENVDFASILYCYAANENGNGNSPNGANTKYIDNNNGKGGMYWAQNSQAGIQKYLGTNLVREPENYSADVAFIGTTDLGNGATVYLKDHVGNTNSGNPTVEQALASGMSKLVVTVYVSNVDAKVYYWDKARDWETNIESEGALATIDENGFATVTIDISEFDAANANYLTLPYLKGNNGDWMAYMSIKFAK